MTNNTLTVMELKTAMDLLKPHLVSFRLRGAIRLSDTGCWLRVEKIGMAIQIRLRQLESELSAYGLFMTTLILPDDEHGVKIYISFLRE